MSARTDDAPLVGIGMPVYQAAAQVERAIQSLLGQTYEHFAVVVWDNGSDDGTAEVARSAARDDPRVDVRTRPVNVGATRNFNDVFSATEGPLFMWAAHDDTWDPEFLARSVAALNRDRDAVVSVCATRLISPRGERVGLVAPDVRLASERLGTRVRGYLRSRPGWYHVYGLMRRDALAATALFQSTWGPDVLLVWELLLRGRATVVDEPLFSYTVGFEKSLEERATSLVGSGSRMTVALPNVGLWIRLWRSASRALRTRERWIVRRELVLALGTRPWLGRIGRDVQTLVRLATHVGRGARHGSIE